MCPICKSNNYFNIINNCNENIYLTGKSYSYKFCSNCFVTSQYPLPDNESLNKHYKYLETLTLKQSNSKKGLNLYLKIKDSYKKRNLKNIIRNLLKFGDKDYSYFNLLNRGNILDLGSGTGLFSFAAEQEGFEVISLEQSKAAVEISKRIGTNVILSDINSKLAMRYASKVDNITLNHVFEHIKDPLEFLKRLRENIRESTKIVIVVPNSDSIWRYIFKENWYGWDPPVHIHLYNKDSLKIIMNKIGFSIEYISSLNKIDAFLAAITHRGFKLNKIKILLRIISFFMAPFLKKFNIAPEIICIISKTKIDI